MPHQSHRTRSDRAGRPGRLTRVALLLAAVVGGLVVAVAAPTSAPGIAGAASLPFQAVAPSRLADTRPGFGTVDGQGAGAGPSTDLVVAVTGRAGVPPDATAVTVNVTVTEATGDGFVTVYPCGQARPWASNLNFGAAQTVPNLVTAQLGNGAICLFSTTPTHLIVDLLGWYGPGAPINAINPARVADTRAGSFTVDGASVGGGPLTTLEVSVAGRAGVPADAAAVLANVTVHAPAAAGFVTVYPCGASFPLASNLNFSAGQTVANLVLARIGSGGKICLYSSSPAHLIVDITAWAPAGSNLSAISPARLLDTRVPGGATVDSLQAGVGKPRAGVYVDLPVAGRAGVPANAAAVFLNVTVTEPEAGGYVTVFPCGQALPNASNLNVVAGQTVPNLALVQLGTAGAVCLYTTGRAQLIVDVAGWIPGGTTPPGASGPTMVRSCPIFPADNPWNSDISANAVRAESAGWVSAVGGGNLHADFGSDPTYGIPFTVVAGSEPLRPMAFYAYGDESDPGPYPVPLDAPVESGSDGHVLVLQQDSCKLYELGNASPSGNGWLASGGATFDLRSNALRPDRWTSADAAGLPILPGLVRYDEVRSGVITHALRFTVPSTQRGFVHPATHFAGNTPASPPMGARYRLKASFDLSAYHGDALVVLTALQKYGMIVADNGTGWYISGATDSRWNDEDLNQLKVVPGSAFEVVDTGPVLS